MIRVKSEDQSSNVNLYSIILVCFTGLVCHSVSSTGAQNADDSDMRM